MTSPDRELGDNPLQGDGSGETDPDKLLAFMAPELTDGEYVFCSLKNSRYGEYAETAPIASFQEPEGLSLVVSKESAEHHGLNYSGIYRCITLGVHSSLDAVGLTGAVSARLARHGISANVIAAFYHDHVFVPADRSAEALHLLLAMTTGNKPSGPGEADDK